MVNVLQKLPTEGQNRMTINKKTFLKSPVNNKKRSRINRLRRVIYTYGFSSLKKEYRHQNRQNCQLAC